jgi:pilus assembly protein CpaE
MSDQSPLNQASETLRFIGFATDAHSRKELAMAAASRGWLQSEIREGSLADAHAYVAATAPPALLVIDLSGNKAPLASVDALADVCAADTRVLAIGTANDVALFRGLRALGVQDYLLKPLDPLLLRGALDMLIEGVPAAPAPAASVNKARVLVFTGARGGAGTTTLAIATAAMLAEDKARRVLFLDLDLQTGSAALDLDLEPSPGLAAILGSPDRVDQTLVDSALRPHPLGFSLLTAQEPADLQLTLEPEGVLALLAAIGARADMLVIDLPRRFDQAARAVLRVADSVVIVTPQSLSGLRDTKRLAGLITGLRAGQQPLFVANRCGQSTAELSQSDFERGLGVPLTARISDAPRMVAKAALKATAVSAVEGGPAVKSGLRLLLAALPLAPASKASSSAGALAKIRRLISGRIG